MKPGLLMLPSAVSDSRVHNILPNKIDTDFQFSRASSATRVNHQGLIENVGYFSDELVRNGDFSELGPEIIINGDFATDSDWTLGTGWTISNGKLRADNVSLINTFQAYVYTSGKTYKVTYTISDYVKGEVRFQLGGGGGTVNGTARDANGTYTEYIVATNNHTSARFRALSADGGFTGNIDNVSVKQVDPDNDWILGTGWSFSDNKVVFDGGADAAVTQSNTVEPSTLYRTSFTVADKTTGSLQLRLGNSAVVDVTVTDNGNFSFDLTTDASGTSVYFRAIGGFNGSLSNVSVKQILGDKPRLDYDPTNPTCPHLLLEPQSTNLIPFSEDFSNGWVNQNTIDTANQTTSPDGANNGTQLTNTTSSSNYIYRQVTLSTSTDYSISVFVKKGTSNIARLDTWDTTGSTQGSIQLNLDTEVTSIITGTASFEKYPNDWYKLKVSFTSSGSLGTTYYRIFNDDGVNGSYIYMFGAQLEQQSYCTSYIPTAGAAETRVRELLTKGGNVDTFNSTEGVLYAEIAALADNQTYRNISISDGVGTNAVRMNFNTTSNRISSINRVGGSNTAFISYDATDITQYQKVAFKFKLNDFAVYANGTEIGTDTSGAVNSAGAFNTLNFDQADGGSPFYGKVKSLATYNRALTDTELYTITSTQYSAYSGMVAALGNYTIPC
ncbi:MAG: hypothetical protein CBC27_08485 [Opitutia bacterium TMED67]|nr:MAG: hypothetical protein CBC27_08485 [Opitutae bacterium TMED67]